MFTGVYWCISGVGLFSDSVLLREYTVNFPSDEVRMDYRYALIFIYLLR